MRVNLDHEIALESWHKINDGARGQLEKYTWSFRSRCSIYTSAIQLTHCAWICDNPRGTSGQFFDKLNGSHK